MPASHRQHPGPEPRGAALKPLTPPERHERKRRILAHGQPSVTRSIAEAIVIKSDNLFFLTTKAGEVPTRGGHGLGLYYHDCRDLNGYTLRLAGTDPTVLVANAGAGDRAVLELTNVDLHAGERVIPKETIAVTWERAQDGERLRLSDQLTLRNLSLEPVAFPITLTFDAASVTSCSRTRPDTSSPSSSTRLPSRNGSRSMCDSCASLTSAASSFTETSFSTAFSASARYIAPLSMLT